MTKSVWDEHEENQEAQPDQAMADNEALESVSDAEVVGDAEREHEDSPPKKKGGNFKLMFAGFVLVAVTGSGLMFYKLINRHSPADAQAQSAPEMVQPALAPTPAAEVIAQPPVEQVGAPQNQDAAIAAMTAQINAALVTDGQPAPGQPAPVAPSVPGAAEQVPVQPQTAAVVADRSAEIERMQGTIDRLQQQLAKAQEDLSAAHSAKPAAHARTAEAVLPRQHRKPYAPAPSVPAKNKPVITEEKSVAIADASIRAIYPVSGKNPQAWVSVGGEIKEVSVGGFINGARVKSISPETMEIVTDAGTIRARAK